MDFVYDRTKYYFKEKQLKRSVGFLKYKLSTIKAALKFQEKYLESNKI